MKGWTQRHRIEPWYRRPKASRVTRPPACRIAPRSVKVAGVWYASDSEPDNFDSACRKRCVGIGRTRAEAESHLRRLFRAWMRSSAASLGPRRRRNDHPCVNQPWYIREIRLRKYTGPPKEA